MNKKNESKNNARLIVSILAVVLLLSAVVVGIVYWKQGDVPAEEDASAPTQNMSGEDTEASETTVPEKTEDDGQVLSDDLYLTKIGSYTGAYMEDASDEFVTGVLMIMVENRGEKPLQYAEIVLSGEAGEAHFALSTLNPGQSMVVLEQERKAFTSAEDYPEVSIQNVVFFDKPLDTQEDVLKIQPLDGGFNITNISDRDIDGEIVVYFKHSAADVLYGGITFRGRIEGGMKAGEIRQVMSSNFNANATTVMFVTIEGEA